jgi:hypothetical protein
LTGKLLKLFAHIFLPFSEDKSNVLIGGMQIGEFVRFCLIILLFFEKCFVWGEETAFTFGKSGFFGGPAAGLEKCLWYYGLLVKAAFDGLMPAAGLEKYPLKSFILIAVIELD